MKVLRKTDIETIIKGCKKGDHLSQDKLVRRFAPVLMSICQRYCRDRSLAEDALQDTFVNIFSYIKGYSGKGSFEGWMRRIAVNCSFTAIKKIHPVSFYQGIEVLTKMSTEIPDAYSQMGKEELMNLIQRLPRGQYMVFNLNVIEGYRHVEIAEILNISASSSRSNLSRARVNLIKMMQEEKFEKLKRSIQ